MDVREKLVELANDVLRYLPWGEIQKDTAERIADRMMDHGVTVQEWIPVTERLPEQSGKYIVCSERKIKVGNWERMEKKVYQAKYYVYPTGCHWGQRDKGKHITHWMPMPEVPKGE